MQTSLTSAWQQEPLGQEAQDILRACVHCGFCSATCPTYQLLGDELDSPRGRIYLIKQVLEGQAVSDNTRLHLDRCLTCRACETTCPSGVRYHRLKTIGHIALDQQQPAPLVVRLKLRLLRLVLPYPQRFAVLLKIAKWLKPWLPKQLQQKIPVVHSLTTSRNAVLKPAKAQRQVILPNGCVQAVTQPQTHQAAQNILARLGISVVKVEAEVCCGAMSYHTGGIEEGLQFMRRNIDAWWPSIQAGQVEAIVSTASGCGLMLKEYGESLKHDPNYAEKAAKISQLTQDIGDYLSQQNLQSLQCQPQYAAVAFHPPCTLQHGQQQPDTVANLLKQLGFQLTPIANSHLCCGSAGTYSLLQAPLSQQLLRNKLAAIEAGKPDCIVSANIGCQLHLESLAQVPVKHWIELLEESLPVSL